VLSDGDRRSLLRLAREAIRHRLVGGAAPPTLNGAESGLRGGAFVSVHLLGSLRGCIGHPSSDRCLAEVVAECAVAAATEDPRFAPLRPEELAHAHLEISVLGPITAVSDVSEIEVGRHGLIVEQGHRRGLLLPQVATAHAWDRATFLAHTCLKAGLRADAWKSGAAIRKFEAEVFGEEPGSIPTA
jgi:AmmeMemoRadiSam system protein A